MTEQNDVHDFKGDVRKLSLKLKLFVAAVGVLEKISPAIAAQLMADKFVTPRRKKNADYSTKLPPGARRIEVFHNLTKLTGWTWGESGPAVLLIHGWEGHTGRMIPLIEPLLRQGYRVFALDAPGHGLSPSAKTHLGDVGLAIQAMIEQHGPFYGIIAHSFGAAATAIILDREPQLMPEKLVLLSPMRDLQQHFDIFAGIAQLSPALKARVQPLAAECVGCSFDQLSTIKAVRSFRLPGLIIHDRHDTLISHEVSQDIMWNWPGAQLVSTYRLGHRQGLADTDVWYHILGFLAGDCKSITDLYIYKNASGY